MEELLPGLKQESKLALLGISCDLTVAATFVAVLVDKFSDKPLTSYWK